MPESANLTSVEVLSRTRAAMHEFLHGAGDALAIVQLEMQRAIEWVQHERPAYWEAMVRKSYDAVAEAKSNLERRRMIALHGERPACHEEQKALEKAKLRLRLAEEKLEAVKRWQRVLAHEFKEYTARAGQLGSWLETDGPKALAAVGRMSAAIEAYLSMPAPVDRDGAVAVTSMARDEEENEEVKMKNEKSDPQPLTPDP